LGAGILDDTGKGADRSVRVEDVARVAGVSPITVSRTLRTPDIVKPETRRRVEEAVAKTGYVVNTIASSLRSGQSAFISVFVASLQNPHYAAAIQGMIDAFEGTRFRLTFSQSGYAEDMSAEQLRMLLPFRPAAFVFSGVVRNEEARTYLRSLHVPVMEMWGETESPIDMLVASPGREGGRLLGEHLVGLGVGHIAYIGHTNSRAAPRIEGFRAALRGAHLDIALLHSVEGTTEMEEGLAVVDTVLDQLPQCDAMVFGTDVMAAGALLRLQEMGKRVPDDIAVAGYGDLFFAAHTRPRLTSIRTAPYDVGRRAGELLRTRLTVGRAAEPVIQVPLSLVIRESTVRKP
jgi:LacI family gluconate utilization system Gnt-I transcriptional repressor